MADTKLRPASIVADNLGGCLTKVDDLGDAEFVEWDSALAAQTIEARDREVTDAICAFIKRWATTPGRNASIYTAHELERAIRAEFGDKTDG